MARDTGIAKIVSASMPPPAGFTIFTRVVEICVLIVGMIWVFGYLGGVGFSPIYKGENTNDPSVIFNWHPLFMALAFPICMAEAVLAYRAPIATTADKYSQLPTKPCHVSDIVSQILIVNCVRTCS